MPAQRRAQLSAAAVRMRARGAELVECMMAETGATKPWAYHNVEAAAEMIEAAAALVNTIQGSVLPTEARGKLSLAVRQPAGVVLSIAPWNAPIILATRAIALPLACGNTVVLKASEMCPALHVLIGEIFIEAGFAAGEVNVVTNALADAAEVVNALIDHPAVRRINFTGSTAVGRLIAERASRQLKPVLLELGGKAPLIVLDDADLDAAVDAAVFGAFFNQGQICMSTERIIVDAKVADTFSEKFAARAAALRVGRPADNPDLGAVIDHRTAERVAVLIGDAVQRGARVVAGGPAQGLLMPATVLDGVNATMRIFHEESFGPVVSIVRVDGDEAALACANDTPYGLTASVFSTDVMRALAIAKRIESGICHINGATVADEPQAPFGGVKDSGYGRFGGSFGMHEFTELRWITIQAKESGYPI
jgi:acyl-CoA reductase-like NAD-dependent aldehyde dehydrogenase